jgi:hypothetical protein
MGRGYLASDLTLGERLFVSVKGDRQRSISDVIQAGIIGMTDLARRIVTRGN